MFETILRKSLEETILDFERVLLCIIVAIVLGIIIGICILIANKGRCSKDYIIGLILLPAIVSVVIMLVGSNVARAFSMAGVFALVRFRSAPGTAKDITVIFLAMSAGLSCGLGLITFAGVVVLIMCSLLIVVSLIQFPEERRQQRMLKITIPENLNYQGVFDSVFNKYLHKYELRNVKTTNMGSLFELTYMIEMKAECDEKEFIDELRCKNGNLTINLGMCVKENIGMLN